MVRPFAVVQLLFAAIVANAQPHLVFDHKIGTDWPPNSNGWMSFVAISSDGQTVAGDASVLLKEEDHLAFWAFTDSKFLRSIDGVPLAISPDFRSLVLQKQILDLQSGNPTLTMVHKQDMLDAAAFSADGELVAVKASPHLVRGAQVAILRTKGALWYRRSAPDSFAQWPSLPTARPSQRAIGIASRSGMLGRARDWLC